MIDSMATSFRSKEELAPRYYDNSAGLGQWNDSTAGQGRSALFFDPLDLDVEAVTNVAAMTAAAREQLAGFLCRLASTHHSSLRVTTTAAWNIFNFALLSIVSTRASIGHLTGFCLTCRPWANS